MVSEVPVSKERIYQLKVLFKPPTETTKTYQTTCKCGAVLEYLDLDIQENISGNRVIFCPECLTPIEIDDVTKTISYPKDYYDFKDGVDIENNEINKWIKECVNDCKDNGGVSCRASGNTIVVVIEYEDEYEVIVSKNYSTAEIEK